MGPPFASPCFAGEAAQHTIFSRQPTAFGGRDIFRRIMVPCTNGGEFRREESVMGRMGLLVVAALLLASTSHGEEYCFDEAGDQYGINPRILKAIAGVESNLAPRAINRNRNGTYD